MTDHGGQTASAAVVGAAGFVGRRLYHALHAAGTPTAAFTRATPLVTAGRPAPALGHADVIFFLASSITPAVAEDRPSAAEADQAALVELLDALERSGRCPVFVFSSSGGTIYSPEVLPPYSERCLPAPSTVYGHAKLRMEHLLAARTGTVRPVILRPSTVYGPGQRPRGGHGVVAHWLSAALAEQPLSVYGSPRVVRDYVYVDDVVDAMLLVYQHFGGHPDAGYPVTLNIGSGRGTSLLEVVAAVVDAVGRKLVVEFQPRRPFDRDDVWLDVAAVRRLLGWRPQTTLPDGVAMAWQALCRQVNVEPSRR